MVSKIPTIPDNLVPVSQVAKETKIQQQTLVLWLKKYNVNGKPLGRKIGGKWFVDIDVFKEFLTGQ